MNLRAALGGALAVALSLSLGWTAEPVGAQTHEEWRAWNQPVPPFRIFGPLHYVGASDIAAYAIQTPDGLIVLDGGFPDTAPQIVANLKTLGFGIEQVKILLNSHAHLDHAGGLAELKAKSGGAQLVAHELEAPALESGGRGDFAWADSLTYAPVAVDRRIAHGDTVTLGGVTLTAVHTPGHTKGCTTWTATFEQDGKRLTAIFVGSTSVPDPVNYRLLDNPSYPTIAEDYRRTFERLKDVSPAPDLFLAAHGNFFDLEGKRARLAQGEPASEVFTDPAGYRAYLERSAAAFLEHLENAKIVAAREAQPPQARSER